MVCPLSWELGWPQISADRAEGIGVLGYLPGLGSCLVKNRRSSMCLTMPPFQDGQKRIAESNSLEA